MPIDAMEDRSSSKRHSAALPDECLPDELINCDCNNIHNRLVLHLCIVAAMDVWSVEYIQVQVTHWYTRRLATSGWALHVYHYLALGASVRVHDRDFWQRLNQEYCPDFVSPVFTQDESVTKYEYSTI